MTRGVFQLAGPCWTVVTHEGVPAGFEESEDHFDSEAQAAEAARSYQAEDEPPVRVVQCESACWAAILWCGVEFVHYGDVDAVHFDSEASILECLSDGGAVQVEPGVFTCGDDAECDTCDPLRHKIKQQLAMKNTDPSVLANPAADPVTDPTEIDWPARRRDSTLAFPIYDGRPVNGWQPTLPYGRGTLLHWGERACADAIVLITVPGAGRLVLLGERDDGNGWSAPGGGLNPDELPIEGGLRELFEETNIRVTAGPEVVAWCPRYVPDPRATREAWMVTTPIVIDLGERDRPLNTVCSSDLLRCLWFPATDMACLEQAMEAAGHKLFVAHRRMLGEILDNHR